MINRLQSTYRDYPRNFWVLVGASFIDTIGRTAMIPFFALYVTEKFNVGMTEAGILLGIFSLAGFVGSLIGGALTDRFGRKSIILFGLVVSSLSSLAMGLVEQLETFYILANVVGLLSEIAARPRRWWPMLPEANWPKALGCCASAPISPGSSDRRWAGCWRRSRTCTSSSPTASAASSPP
jgi:MFS family permease